MELVHPDSLSMTLDAITEAFVAGRPLSQSQRNKVAGWIADRQGLPGAYAGMFAPTAEDFRDGCTVFTGERVRSRAATSHILGEEACRALLLFDVPLADVSAALARATEGMSTRLGEATSGFYCCGICSVSLWRHLMAGGLSRQRIRLRAGLSTLKSHRLGNGQWRRFPFWYTLLALSEMNLPEAREEIRYATAVCQSYLRHRRSADKFATRRHLLAEQALA